MGKAISCNKPVIISESLIKVPPVEIITKLEDIDFSELKEIIRTCDFESNSVRIENYGLKGFNKMTPQIKISSSTKSNVTKIKSLLNKANINPNLTNQWESPPSFFSPSDIDKFSEFKFIKLKYKTCVFNKIFVNDFTLNEYGNINLINCIYFLNEKKENYFKKIFTRFEIDKGEYELNLYKNGKKKKIIIDNRIMKKSPFIHCPENNFWVYLLEKGIAKIKKHYLNTTLLLASDIFQILTPCDNIRYIHSDLTRKKLYNIITDNLEAKNTSFILYAEKYYYGNELFNKENYVSFFIKRAFKLSKYKYVELYLPFRSTEKGTYNIQLKNNINEEDIKNFPNIFTSDKLNDPHTFYIKIEDYYTYFKSTFILKYYNNYIYNFERIILSDRNINYLKFKNGSDKNKVILRINLPYPLLFRFIIAKLEINDEIRRINTMSSQKDISGNEEFNSSYTDDVNYNFEYIDSLYKFDNNGYFELEINEGYYCLLFNVYTDNEVKITLSSYSEKEIEFLDIAEKVTKEKLNYQIRTLFISYIKKYENNNKENKAPVENNENNKSEKYNTSSYYIANNIISENITIKKSLIKNQENLISYESLINENFGYSIILIENNSTEYNIFASFTCDTEGMNLITKEYVSNNSNDLSIIVPPKNKEMIIFEWEKTLDEIIIEIETDFVIDKIIPTFSQENFDSLDKKYIVKKEVYYIEIQYRRGVFIIFVNESMDENYVVQISFDNVNNLQYKGIKGNEFEGKVFKYNLTSRSYRYCNLKTVILDDFSYKIGLKICKKNDNLWENNLNNLNKNDGQNDNCNMINSQIQSNNISPK